MLLSGSIISKAIEAENDSNFIRELSQMTISDLSQMSHEEYLELLSDFERICDPYGTYNNITDEGLVTVLSDNETASPSWTSGDINNGEWVEAGTHEYITMQACSILINDKGFFSLDTAEGVTISLMISLASLLPDKDERGIILFAGHFYNPNTGKNYVGQTSNTALTNAVAHYDSAISAANSGNMTLAYEYLGRCLHYIQDICQPHHAANITAVNYAHSRFEGYAYENVTEFTENCNSISSFHYNNALSNSVSTLTHNAALKAYSMADDVDNVLNQDKWESVATTSLANALMYSTKVMYKFGNHSATPFSFN